MLAQSTCDRNNKGMYGCFYESKKFHGYSMQRETCQLEKKKKKKKDGENLFFKALANRFCLTSKSCSWFNKVVNDQLSNQMDFMKR